MPALDVLTLQVPRPLPAVPCLVYDGRRVQWDRWETAPRVLCSKLDQSCEGCGDRGPASIAKGLLLPHDGETVRVAVKVGTYPSGRPRFKGRVRPAHAWLRLTAFLCPACFRLDVVDDHPELARDGPGGMGPAELVLCDGCDAPCGVGVDLVEARANLVALGGWSAAEADWDLCAGCNPATAPDPSPRALAARRAPG